MHSIYAFLAIVLIQTLGMSAVEARGSALSWVSPCTLDVVLVTFQDATTSADGYDYHLQDRPHGSNDGGAYPDPDSSYTLRDFERLFSGGYDGLPDFVGTKAIRCRRCSAVCGRTTIRCPTGCSNCMCA